MTNSNSDQIEKQVETQYFSKNEMCDAIPSQNCDIATPEFIANVLPNMDDNVETLDTDDDAKNQPSTINAVKFKFFKKLTTELKNTLKKRFQLHWCESENGKFYTCPAENKIIAESYLQCEKIEFESSDIYDQYFQLSYNKQKADKLDLHRRVLEKGGIQIAVELGNLLRDFNKQWASNLSQETVLAATLENINDLCTSENKKQRAHLEILIKWADLVKKQKQEISSVKGKIISLTVDQEETASKDASNNLPSIKVTPGELHIIVDSACALLEANNSGIYQRGGQLVQIVTAATSPKKKKNIVRRADDALVITFIDQAYLTETLGKLARWEKFDSRASDNDKENGEAWRQTDCPEKVSRTLLARKEWKLPVLTGIIQAPTLRSDGSILEIPGYDGDTGLYFNPGQEIFPKIPEHPTREDALISLNKIRKLLVGFPFEHLENESKVVSTSESVAISAILTGLIRKSIRTAPIHGFSAPKMGSGKSLLADVVGLFSTGKPNCVLSQADNEEEEAKRLLAVLMEGDPIICYDNIERPFGSPALCSVTTQEFFKGRLLGTSTSATVSTNATFLATGNNLTFVGDLSSRAILCSLDSQLERPEERAFDINLYEHIPQHRGELVQAALTVLRAYHAAGRPKQKIKPYGRFEEWSDWIRSALVWLDLADPCTSRTEIENADPVRASLGNLLTSWFAVFDNIAIKIKAAVQSDNEQLKEALLEFAPDGRGGINEISLGKKFQQHNKRPEAGYYLEKMPRHQGSTTWRVVKKS